jgi:electron transfer flavoprotein-quinone oxidoreductase
MRLLSEYRDERADIMTETDFDIIIVGSGCAGAVAAYVAATAGKSVLVVERGEYAGAKNMTGGRIYSHALKQVFPNFEAEAPLERKITHERISMLDAQSNTTLDFASAQLAQEGRDSYSVLRAPFDQWLALKAETAGAEYICGIAVEALLKDESGTIRGISAGGDEITAQVTIVADGANSLLSAQATGASRPQPNHMAVGIKEVYELSSSQIEDRFLCNKGEGASWLFVGDATHGRVGGGFLYTNRESLSIGLVVTISSLAKADTPLYQMMEDFKAHPAVAPVIRGARLAEHSGHMVSEGGYTMIPEYVGNGVLLAGDTAMLCMNLGYMVRGMDLAVASGRMAAEAAVEALDEGDTSKAGLASYSTNMEDSFVIRDLKTFRRWPTFMEGWIRLFTLYPSLCKDVLNSLFVVDGTPQDPLVKRIKPLVKKAGVLNLLQDARGALKSL